MARDLIKMMLIGRLGTDPEMRYTANGAAVTSFRLACSRRPTGRQGQDGDAREETEWFTVVGWNKLAETMNTYLSKGAKVYVEGRFQSRSYEGQDGQKRFVNEVVASEMLMLDSRRTADRPDAAGEGSSLEEIQVDDIPF